LQGAVQRASFQGYESHLITGLANHNYFRMRGWIKVHVPLVETHAYSVGAFHQHGSHLRSARGSRAKARLLKGEPHELLILSLGHGAKMPCREGK
jgi:hypothetical protein